MWEALEWADQKDHVIHQALLQKLIEAQEEQNKVVHWAVATSVENKCSFDTVLALAMASGPEVVSEEARVLGTSLWVLLPTALAQYLSIHTVNIFTGITVLSWWTCWGWGVCCWEGVGLCHVVERNKVWHLWYTVYSVHVLEVALWVWAGTQVPYWGVEEEVVSECLADMVPWLPLLRGE